MLASAALVGVLAVPVIVLVALGQPPAVFVSVPVGMLAVDLLVLRLDMTGLRRMVGRAFAPWANLHVDSRSTQKESPVYLRRGDRQ